MPMQDRSQDSQVLGHTKGMNKPLCSRVPVRTSTIQCKNCPECS